jgi:hypothetical protein
MLRLSSRDEHSVNKYSLAIGLAYDESSSNLYTYMKHPITLSPPERSSTLGFRVATKA